MFLDSLSQIVTFVFENFLKMWPYLLFSIPLAVLIRATNASQYIRRAFVTQPLLAIALATAIGAFSPFCSCSVIPLIASLLIAGVPLGPVMAFWIASPTMDPEIFLLSLGMLGTDLAVARVVATLLLSFGAGLTAHLLEKRGLFREGILREQKLNVRWSLKRLAAMVTGHRTEIEPQRAVQPMPIAFVSLDAIPVASMAAGATTAVPLNAVRPLLNQPIPTSSVKLEVPKWQRIRKEAIDATVMVIKFMLIAFVLEAIITLYVPQTTIIAWLGNGNPLAILLAALVGVPVYTTNLTALPLVSGLLQQGMLPGAALAFLIAGPATTIPAMSAVYGIAKPRVFIIYLASILIGAVLLGYGYQMLLSF
jgi:uncharacterized membrane protein YraQ (UPF0718 family)